MTVFNSLIEYSRNGANLTPVGTVGTGPDRNGVAGEAMTFTGVDNSYYQAPLLTGSSFQSGFTVVAWINQAATGANAQSVCSVFDTAVANSQWRLFVLTDNTLQFNIVNSLGAEQTIVSNRSITNATWEPVAIVFDNVNDLIKIYTKQGLDNQEIYTDTINPASTINFRIGGYPAAVQRPFDGSVGPVYAFDSVLTTQEIADVFDFKIPNEIYGSVSSVTLGDFGSSSALSPKINLLDIGGTLAVTGTVADVADEQNVADAASEWTGVANSAVRTTDTDYNLSDSFFVAGKIKVDALGAGGWVASQASSLSLLKWLFVKTSGDELLFRLYNNAEAQFNATSTTSVLIDTEYHITGVYASTVPEVRLYVDGVLEDTVPVTGTILAGDTGFAIGNQPWSTAEANSSAIVDDVVFGSGVPSLSDIQAIAGLSTNFQDEHGILQVDITGLDSATWEADDGVTTYGPFVGDSAHSLPPETYTISFSGEIGFIAPPDITGVVIADQSYTTESGAYIEGGTGSLTITITGEPVNGRWFATSTTTSEVYGPFESGEEVLTADTYDISFSNVRGSSTPNDINGIVIVDSGSVVDSGVYIATNYTERYVRPLGQAYGNSSGDSYANAVTGLSNVKQWELQLNGFIRIRGEHTEGIVLTYPSINLNYIGDSDNGSTNGKTEVVNTWTVHSGNIWKVQTVIQPNIDFNQQTEPAVKSIGDRWYLPTREVGKRYGQTGYIWDGSVWSPDPTWFIQPQLVWLDDVRVNSSKSTALEFKEIDGSLTQTVITDSDLAGEVVDYWKGATVVFKHFSWTTENRVIDSSTGSTITYPAISVASGYKQEFYYVENIIGECTTAGDWAYQDGFLYMYFTSDPNIAGNKVEYSGVNHGVYGVNVDDITIDKANIINTNDSAIRLIGCENPIVIEPVINTVYCRGDWGYSAGSIDLWGLDPRDYDPIAVRTGDFTGITRKTKVSVTNPSIQNVHGGSGVYVSMYDSSGVGDTGEITGSYIRNCGFSPTETIHVKQQPNGIFSYGCDSVNIDTNNDIKYVSYVGIMNLSSGNALVQYNKIDNAMRNFRDGAAIYMFGIPANNNIVSLNQLTNVIASSYDTNENPIAFVYTDEYSSDNLIELNTCFNIDSTQLIDILGFFNNNTTETPPNVYQNNTVYADNLTAENRNTGTVLNATFSDTYFTEAQAITITPTITGSDDGRLDVNGIEYADSEVAYINAGLVSPTWEAVPEYNSPSAITPFTAVLSTDYPISGEYVVAGIALTAQDITTGFPTIGTPILNDPIIPIDLISQDITTGIPTIGQPRLNFSPKKASNFRTLTVNAGGRR